MLFHPTKLSGVRLIELAPARDERGFFARTFCEQEFDAQGLQTAFAQHSISFTARTGSIRGLHYQRPPHEEVKIVRCVAGAIYDVLVDIRPESPTYLQYEAYHLRADNCWQLYVPSGMAHGFQTLEPNTEIHYLISVPYAPAAAAGIRYDDPAFSVSWPLHVADISIKDRAWPPFVSR